MELITKPSQFSQVLGMANCPYFEHCILIMLFHCSLVTPYAFKNFGQHWYREKLCCLFGVNKLPEPILIYSQLNPLVKFEWKKATSFLAKNAFVNDICTKSTIMITPPNLKWKQSTRFLARNAFENNICKTSTIMITPQCINCIRISLQKLLIFIYNLLR